MTIGFLTTAFWYLILLIIPCALKSLNLVGHSYICIRERI